MPELPNGIVTFLFTDIEGSTQLLHQLGDQYAQLLNDQKQLLRAAFATLGGYEVDNQGDSFFYAFQEASDALAAAVQTALFNVLYTAATKIPQTDIGMGMLTNACSAACPKSAERPPQRHLLARISAGQRAHTDKR